MDCRKRNVIFYLLYLCLAIPTYFFIDGGIEIGGYGFMYHYISGVAIAVLGFIVFLIIPNINMMKNITQTALIMAASYIITIIISLIIWAVTAAEPGMMIEGFFRSVYVILAIIIAAASAYILKEKVVLITCIAMSIANVMLIIPAMIKGGAFEYFKELITLIVSFGQNTGNLMRTSEIHDLTFAFGLYLLYALLNKNLYGRKTVLILSVIFSLTGFKRIAIAGIIVSIVLYLILSCMQNKTAKCISVIIIALMMAISALYIIAVHYGLFDYLEMKGIDTKGRNLIYGYVNKLYDIRPDFIGYGIGFSGAKWNLPIYSKLQQDAYHNDFLRMFVELGFFGYFIWLFTQLPLRFCHIFKTQDKKGWTLFLCMAVYCFMTYATDNTYYYYYINMAMAILVLYPYTEKGDNIGLINNNSGI